MDLLLDESVPVQIEMALDSQGIDTGRYMPGEEDDEVLMYAIEKDAPVLTRDQGDFVKLSREFSHPGILMDKQLHLREDFEMVAETIEMVLEQFSENLSDNVWYLSEFYGR
ncbi:MAG: DUF5615 family PIN-like protein [Candidatus Nanohaloarchaea archaeon]